MTDTDDGDFEELKVAVERTLTDYADARALPVRAFYAGGRPDMYRIRTDVIRALREAVDWIDKWGSL